MSRQRADTSFSDPSYGPDTLWNTTIVEQNCGPGRIGRAALHTPIGGYTSSNALSAGKRFSSA